MFGKKKNITVIDINGAISTHKNVGSKYDHSKMIKTLSDLYSDDSVKGVIIRVNSPGGSAGASYELFDLIKKLTERKTVYATVTDIACSGAYLAIAAVDKIFATPMSIVGSIGVLMELPNFKEVSDKIGFKLNVLKSGRMKDIGNPFRDMTAEEKEYIQDILRHDHNTFTDIILKYRARVDKNYSCDGRFFSGEDGKTLGFVDALGTFHDALEQLKRIIETEDVKYISEDTSFAQKLLSKLNINVSLNLDSSFLGRYL